jgi:hypothetical protein
MDDGLMCAWGHRCRSHNRIMPKDGPGPPFYAALNRILSEICKIKITLNLNIHSYNPTWV